MYHNYSISEDFSIFQQNCRKRASIHLSSYKMLNAINIPSFKLASLKQPKEGQRTSLVSHFTSLISFLVLVSKDGWWENMVELDHNNLVQKLLRVGIRFGSFLYSANCLERGSNKCC